MVNRISIIYSIVQLALDLVTCSYQTDCCLFHCLFNVVVCFVKLQLLVISSIHDKQALEVERTKYRCVAVSYTHLTLPTILRV